MVSPSVPCPPVKGRIASVALVCAPMGVRAKRRRKINVNAFVVFNTLIGIFGDKG
jgi:hypothetical protein